MELKHPKLNGTRSYFDLSRQKSNSHRSGVEVHTPQHVSQMDGMRTMGTSRFGGVITNFRTTVFSICDEVVVDDRKFLNVRSLQVEIDPNSEPEWISLLSLMRGFLRSGMT